MASSDVRDVLNIPTDGSAPRPAKKQKVAAARPNLKGLAREVQNLGGDNPIAIVPEIFQPKKRRFASRKPAARWEMRPFRNSARNDNGSLVLRHWRKKTGEDAAAAPQNSTEDTQQTTEENTDMEKNEMEDSSFAKFNVQAHIPEYSEDQYFNSNLDHDDWTKDETDYLLETVRSYDLRWPLIWDRYSYQPPMPTVEGEHDEDPITAVVSVSKERSMEDLKARYYEVAAKMMALTKPPQYMTQAEFSLHEVMTSFNPLQEAQRKKFAETSLSRSKDEAREEESLLLEVRRILARTEKFNQERRELYNRLDYPHTEQDINAFKSSAGLQTLLQNLMNVDKSRKQRKSIAGTDGLNTPASAGPSGTHPGSTPVSETRRESIAASSVTGHRDSISQAERPERPTKKGPQQPQQKKLTEQEELLYGVAHFDRLPSGPTFRYEKINKILSTKSHAQHTRILNTLHELEVPARPNMPTTGVVGQMEKLLTAIGLLLDMRKLNDKFDGEIKLELAKKAERNKALGITEPEPETKTEAEDKEKQGDEADSGATEKEAATATDPADESKEGEEEAATETDKAAEEKDASTTDPAATEAAETNGTGEAESMDVDAPANIPEVKIEAVDDKPVRPESSGGHKRSASVLSTASNSSAKRQKK